MVPKFAGVPVFVWARSPLSCGYDPPASGIQRAAYRERKTFSLSYFALEDSQRRRSERLLDPEG